MPFIETSGKKILFVHIPKTGGTSIEKAMEGISDLNFCSRAILPFLRTPPEHFTYQNICSLFGEGYFDYVFTVVRNPYKRIESEYRMRALLAKERFFTELPTFPIWLEQTLDQVMLDRGYCANHLRPQIEFIGRNVNVFRYEEGLCGVVDRVSQETGIRLILPEKRYLDSNGCVVESGWTSHSIHLVNKFYADDFDAFSYEMVRADFIKR